MPRAFLSVLLLMAVIPCPRIAFAQRDKREPLTDAQIEQIRDAGIDPNQRISLYTKFLEERSGTIKGLTNRARSAARARRIDDELKDFTALMDELGDNLDQYGDRKADMRPALKKLNEDCPRWLGILKALPAETPFDVSRDDAIESGKDLSDQAARLLSQQTAYFAANKDLKGQQREEPK